MAPTVRNIRRHAGIAGQYSYTAEVTYPGEAPESVELVGSVYGPPITLVTAGGQQIFVSSAVTDRIGEILTPEWVHAFFADME